MGGFDPWIRKMLWRREWLPTLVFLPREFHGQRSLAGYNPGVAKSRTWLSTHTHTHTHTCTHTHTHTKSRNWLCFKSILLPLLLCYTYGVCKIVLNPLILLLSTLIFPSGTSLSSGMQKSLGLHFVQPEASVNFLTGLLLKNMWTNIVSIFPHLTI